VNRWAKDPNFQLRDNNLPSMVAGHWCCSVATVWKLIRSGALQCNRFGDQVRITRSQVLECEAAAVILPRR